jgi:beta-phosphoglucomutase
MKENNMPNGILRGAIWDMDGTLVDTAQLHFEAWATACREKGRDFNKEDFAATFGQRNPEIINKLFGYRFSEAESAALGDHKEELYRAAARTHGVELLPGVAALMPGLHRAGVRQAIGSSAPRANLDLILRLTKIEDYLQAIVAAEDTQRGKPDPQVFLIAADRLGVPAKSCVVFEDAVAGVQAAKAGGMACVAVRFVGHHPEEKLRAAGADRVVKSLEQISVEEVLAMIG